MPHSKPLYVNIDFFPLPTFHMETSPGASGDAVV